MASQIGAPVGMKAKPAGEFEALVAEYRLRAFHFALQIVGNREDAMDVTQEAFLKVHRNWAMRDASRPFAPWFYAILRNMAIDFLRKRASRREEAPETAPDIAHTPGPEALAVKGEIQEQVWQAIAQLPEQQREVLVLRDLHGFSYREIAEIVGEESTTVNSRLHDARETMRRKLRRLL
ncbi:MAG: sigma-70 family RNA polymerase sigma factor [Bryobacterales bacterium]|nr:sigma-70 family RNA polymerase sigma factor [Bryobacterales bacterium]